MRLVRVATADGPRTGVLGPDDRVGLLETGLEVVDVLAAEGDARARIARPTEELALAGATLLAAIVPRTLRDYVTFEEHVEGVRRSIDGVGGVPDAWYDAPQFYFSNPGAVFGPYEDVPRPPGCERLDLELEVAAVLGAGGRDLTLAQAHAAIAGYTILNDWSARDLQAREMQVGLGPAKGKDFGVTFGPWVLTADELADRHADDGRLDLELRASIDGVPLGTDRLTNMGWTFAEMVAYASRGVQLHPGDVFGSGTCGSGCLAELWGRHDALEPPPLADGAVVTLEVERLGRTANRVVAALAAPVPIGRARPNHRLPRPWDD